MGIVAKQSIYNSIASYLGIIIGAVNTIVLFPHIFTADEFGLTRVLGAASLLISTFCSFGVPNITLKFFPFFRDKGAKHNGFLFFIMSVPFVGYLVALVLVYVFQYPIIDWYSEKSTLFGDYFNYIALLTFYLVYFGIFDAYLRSLYKTVVNGFLQNVLLRFLWMGLIILYYFRYINFGEFIFGYVNVYALLLLIEVIYLIYLKELFLLPRFENFNRKNLKEMGVFGVFVIFGATTGIISGTIDSLMIGGLIDNGLSKVAFYSIGLYIAAMITIPYTSIIRVATSIISEAWKDNDIKKIGDIYKQTSVNLMLIGSLLFLGIWLNADNIFKILPPEYAEAKYVLLFICIATLYDVSTGVNATIIQFSSFFKLMLYFNILLIFLLVVTNLMLIPLYGIEGAALATLISVFMVNTIRLLIIKVKMGILPFTWNSVYIPLVGTLTYLVVYFIPPFQSYIVDILIRSITIVALFVPSVYLLKVSKEFNDLIDKSLQVLKLKAK